MPEPSGYNSRSGRRGGARILAPLALVLVGGAVALIAIGSSGSSGSSGSAGTGAATVGHRASSSGAAHTVATTATRGGSSTTVTGTSTAGSYTVAAGDTFAKISSATGVSIATIESLNPHVSSNRLTIGQVLKLK